MAKVAIVTGAGRGIGHAIAMRLAREGINVLVTDIDVRRAKAVTKEINKKGYSALALQVDVTNQEHIARMVEIAVKSFGKIDILVNNAAVLKLQPFMEVTESDWDTIFAVNAKGLFFCLQAVASQMIEQRGGRIINISSLSGKSPPDAFSVPYEASKAVVILVTKAAALALAPYHITVNAICPGAIDTPMGKKGIEEVARLRNIPFAEFLGRRLAEIPLGRIGRPEDIAGVVAFLASGDSDYITGESINVNGGLLIE